jgi:ribose 5-phosphate isomerase B
MKIMIGNDHGGYHLKKAIASALFSRGIRVEDIGSDSEEIVRYPYYASLVAKAVAAGKVERGILICSTGIGMSIAANRYRGVRASLCTSTYMGKITRAHNDSNILCLGGKVTGEFEAMDILNVWLDTPYEGGRHDISLSLIRDLEGALAEEREWPGNEEILLTTKLQGVTL